MRPGDSFVAQPVRSLQTMLRIIAMNNARISKAVPDGIYGPDTMQEVSALQRMSGLPQTGVVNEATWNEITRQFGPAAVNVLQAQPVEILLEPEKKSDTIKQVPMFSSCKVCSQYYPWETQSSPSPATPE